MAASRILQGSVTENVAAMGVNVSQACIHLDEPPLSLRRII